MISYDKNVQVQSNISFLHDVQCSSLIRTRVNDACGMPEIYSDAVEIAKFKEWEIKVASIE